MEMDPIKKKKKKKKNIGIHVYKSAQVLWTFFSLFGFFFFFFFFDLTRLSHQNVITNNFENTKINSTFH